MSRIARRHIHASAGRRVAFLALVCAAAVTSCSAPLEPESLHGEYEAPGLIGHVSTLEDGTTRRVTYAGVILGPFEVRRWVAYEEVLPSGEVRWIEHHVRMNYEVDGRRIVTSAMGCPIEMFCLSISATDPPDYLVFGDGLLQLAAHGEPAAHYVRATFTER